MSLRLTIKPRRLSALALTAALLTALLAGFAAPPAQAVVSQKQAEEAAKSMEALFEESSTGLHGMIAMIASLKRQHPHLNWGQVPAEVSRVDRELSKRYNALVLIILAAITPEIWLGYCGELDPALTNWLSVIVLVLILLNSPEFQAVDSSELQLAAKSVDGNLKRMQKTCR